MKKAWVLSYPLSAQRRLWSDWADAQADLSLRRVHMPLCWFCHEVAQIITVVWSVTQEKRPLQSPAWDPSNYHLSRGWGWDLLILWVFCMCVKWDCMDAGSLKLALLPYIVCTSEQWRPWCAGLHEPSLFTFGISTCTLPTWWSFTGIPQPQPHHWQNMQLTWRFFFFFISQHKWAALWQNQQNGMCAQRRLRSAWASAQSDQSSLAAWRKLRSLATHWAHSEDSDQTGQMPKLIWVFAGGTCHFVDFVTRRLKSENTWYTDVMGKKTTFKEG